MHSRTRHGEHEQHEPNSLGSISRDVDRKTRVKSCGSSKDSSQVNVHSWWPVCFQHSLGRAMQSESARTFSGKDADGYLDLLRQKVGILSKPDLGNKLEDYFFRLRRLTGEEHKIRRRLPTAAFRIGACHQEKNQDQHQRQFNSDEPRG